MKKPNFFIVGAPKAGTTSLYYYLKQHPEIYLSPIKEPHYFSKDIRCENFNQIYRDRYAFNIDAYLSKSKLKQIHIAFIEDWSNYLELFRQVHHEKARGEMSGGYLYSSVAAEEISHSIADAKIIMFLRDPIERAFSHWIMNLREDKNAPKDFISAVQSDLANESKGWGNSHLYVELGLYFEQVKRNFQHFPKENIKIFLFEDLKNNVKKVLRELFDFLGVDPSVELDTEQRRNIAALPRNLLIENIIDYLARRGTISKVTAAIPESMQQLIFSLLFTPKGTPQLTVKDREFLLPYFEEDIKKLSILIDRDLRHWLEFPKNKEESINIKS